MGDLGSEGTLRHKTLSIYYPVLMTLGTHLTAVPSLVYNSDPTEYRDLLSTTICAPNAQAGTATPISPVQRTQQEAIDRLVQELVNARGPRGDALVWGTKPWSMSSHLNVSRPGVEAACAQTPASVLRGRPWHILRSRLGDAGFHHLFLSTSLFLPLGNNCYMQLNGAPLSEMKELGKKRPAEGGEADAKRVRPNPKKASPASVTLCRQRIFYGRPQLNSRGKIAHGLPRDHILNRLRPKALPSDEECEALLCVIFDSKAPGGSGARGSLARRATMVGAMREILARQSRIAHGAILSRCLDRTTALGLDGDSTPPELAPVPHTQVCRYLDAVLRSAFPAKFVGAHNFGVILKNMRRLVTLNQNELITVHSLMQGVRVNELEWLCVKQQSRVPASEASKRRELATQFIHWLFNNYLIPLLKSTFYATETPTTGYGTVYFHHAAWANASVPHLNMLVATVLEELGPTETEEALTGQLGAASVRFIPKPNGRFRPIVNLGKRVTSLGTRIGTGASTLPSANEVLKNVQHILAFEMHRQRDDLGGVLFGTNEIFPLLQSLKKELMDERGQLPRLYFAKMDMQSAFDTVKQGKLLEVMEYILEKNHEYALALHCILLPPASKVSQGIPRKLFKTRAAATQAAQSQYGHQAKEMAETMRNAVVADLLRPREVTRTECMDLLRSHVGNNIWQYGNKLYRQKVGIPQGSCLSSLLCSFFYSWLAGDYLGWTRRRGTRLLRYIDDFLLVTDDYYLARRFVTTMSCGFPEYGAHISPSKTVLSFELAHNGQALPVISVRDDSRTYLPFCGFLIDTKTLDFSIDPDRMLSAPIRQSFALRKVREPGASFVGWLNRQLQNRNQVAYVDTHHNSLQTVYLNVFINFALTAMKIPHYFTGSLDARRAALVFGWLVMAGEYTYTAGRARVQHAARKDSAEHYAIRRHAFMFMALSAYRLVLVRKASRFHRVVDLLVRELEGKYRAEADLDVAAVRGWAIVKNAKF
ncbi:hypothetical protein CcaverHIS631_0604120 [Cutaneotrichosporon cavernicola]|nr:hypothetical protein CcaverHIS631_0604120 [Cutaneotrichosporon cavernicola]